MQTNTVIFDMDGLLTDSEPLWNEAATEIFATYGMQLTPAQYATTTGLRTKEFVRWWFARFGVNEVHAPQAEKDIAALVVQKFMDKGSSLPGVEYIFNFFEKRNYKIGLATSSGMELVEAVAQKLNIRHRLHAIASGAEIPYGKPHPQVYLDCAAALQSEPLACICFEDSFNGMIAAKAARMKCVLVPAPQHLQEGRWQAADLKISSLLNFNELLLEGLQG